MITKALNSKVNIKQLSDADFPVQPKQPVIARYNIDSTLNQTLITLPWTVDTINAQDAFFIAVDGKVLTFGSSNDYTMASIDVLGYSNQVLLANSLPAGLNIQAWKLGLKKETEFAQDSRFVNVYDYLDKSFQGYVDQSSVLIATTTTGTPAAGTFYSSITNRASIVDLTQDLKVRMGINRMMVQQVAQLQNEFGPNGEPVWSAVNDTTGQIRFVGSGWTGQIDASGQKAQSSNVNDYVEITFYGTGLNLLTAIGGTSATDYRVSVDGGSEGSNIYPVGSTILAGRNYSQNSVLSVASSLTLGVHTVKIRLNGFNYPLGIYGFEILNSSSNVYTNPGKSYNQGKKILTSNQDIAAYNSVATGTRGGRVLVYQNSDGSIGRAWQAVNASAAYLASTDHSNEEIARTIHWREFGAGRSDDFSISYSSGGPSLAFTLDDGSTTLTGSSVLTDNAKTLGISAAASFITLTFIGTGLDIMRQDRGTGASTTWNVTVDGLSAGSISDTGSTSARVQKIVSGLPYGTHTVKLAWGSGTGYNFALSQFIVYQPKKPTLPSGAIELADYNVLADYLANTVASIDTIASGTIRKQNLREFTFVNGTGGTTDWTTALAVANAVTSGWYTVTDRSAAYVEYTFFGTGFESRFQVSSNGSSNISVSLQSLSTGSSLLAATTANFPSLLSSVYGTGVTFSNGVLDQNDATSSNGAGLSIKGLTLGIWKVRFTNNTASSYLRLDALDIITPIHSYKSNLNYDQQNTLMVGSQGISDNRRISAIKEVNLQTKNISQAVGIVSDPTTTSTSAVAMPDMSVVHYNKTGRIRINYSCTTSNSATQVNRVIIYIDGVAATSVKDISLSTGFRGTISDFVILNVSPGAHKIDLYWYVTAGTATAVGVSRDLTVEEV